MRPPLALALTLALTLAACTTNAEQELNPETLPLHDSEAPEHIQEAPPIPEQPLPSGVLEIGNANAPLTLLLFTEFHCTYCAEFQREQLPLLISDYMNTNKLRIQIAPFTLQKYKNSSELAQAALCGAKQGKGLQTQTMLFEQESVNEASLQAMEIDTDAFNTCMQAEETTTQLSALQDWAKEMGVEYVPTFFLNGEKFIGLQYYADLRGRIEAALDSIDY